MSRVGDPPVFHEAGFPVLKNRGRFVSSWRQWTPSQERLVVVTPHRNMKRAAEVLHRTQPHYPVILISPTSDSSRVRGFEISGWDFWECSYEEVGQAHQSGLVDILDSRVRLKP